jgi:hypothetical protein
LREYIALILSQGTTVKADLDLLIWIAISNNIVESTELQKTIAAGSTEGKLKTFSTYFV